MTDIGKIRNGNLIDIKLNKMGNNTPAESSKLTKQTSGGSDLINQYLENQAQINKPSVTKTAAINGIGSAPENYKNAPAAIAQLGLSNPKIQY